MDKSNQKEYAPMLLVNGNKVFDSFVDHFNDLNGSPFKGHNFPEVFIITPVKSKEQPEDKGDKATDTRPASVIGYIEGEEEYDSVYREIYGAIQAKWPEIDSIHKVPYHPLNPSNRGANQMEGSQEKPDHDKLIKTAAGRILFEYDTSRKDRIREVRLWVEENIQLVFTMDPL
ncbi:hypothetical protein G7Y89_g1957 [Cudoniella acicularis]|uniref:Uncharacterized protein n=1 Tax=Cudoniella acicularis TaxID=354080 RepID=A0A8H4W6Y3_9HELO|nr:hypothetical protein G7Y89_g1957 [Cudoniella acicularis]